MSIEVDYDVSVSCDECGASIDEYEAKVLCSKCASAIDPCLCADACSPTFFKGAYTCLRTKRDFRWDGDLPEFCPRCGNRIRR